MIVININKLNSKSQFFSCSLPKHSLTLLIFPFLISSLFLIPVLATYSASTAIASTGLISYPISNSSNLTPISAITTLVPLGNNLVPMFQNGIGQYDGCTWGDYHLTGIVLKVFSLWQSFKSTNIL